ncbi:MAG: hypothetical protein EBZ74_02435 [Planctomycetia bacterium]|nr:hypothetical protein [Planctomycetia bacterium]
MLAAACTHTMLADDAVVPLPPVEQGVFERIRTDVLDPIRLAALGDPQDLSEPLLPDDVAPPGQPRQEFEPPAGRTLPPGAKPGMLQQALYMATELPRLGTNGLGLLSLEKTATLGLPCPTVESPLLVTPGFVGTLTNPTPGMDVPGELFECYMQGRWLKKIGDRFGADLAVAPGWYSDFKNSSPQALRITGHGFGAWEATEDLRVVAGVIYLDRYDVNLLPAGGLLWTPADDKRFELIFPRPRLAWRVAEREATFRGRRVASSHWLYLAGEFGGNQWAVRSVTGPTRGQNQIMIIRDYRLLAGWERRPGNLGLSWKFETGWVTGRTVQYYLTDQPWLHPSDTFLVRGSVWY